MQIASFGLTFIVIYAPLFLGLIFLVAAGILFARVRSPASALFFFGLLVTTFAPWVFHFTGGAQDSRGMQNLGELVRVVALTVQILGFLFYVLSVPKNASANVRTT